MGSRRYLLSKTLQAVVTLWFVLTFNFFLFRMLPGDPVAMLARSEKLTPADVERLQHELGLDRPLPAAVPRSTCERRSPGTSAVVDAPAEDVKDMIGVRVLPDRAAGRPRHAAGDATSGS